MKLDNKWVRLGLIVTCILLILLLLPALFSKSQLTTQRYVVVDGGEAASDQRNNGDAETKFDSSFFDSDFGSKTDPKDLEAAATDQGSAQDTAVDPDMSSSSDNGNNSDSNKQDIQTVADSQQISKQESDRELDAVDNKQYWRVQMGSFAKMGNVKLLQRRLEQKGYRVVTRASRNGQLTKVLAGELESREQALQLKQQLKKEMGIDGIVVSD